MIQKNLIHYNGQKIIETLLFFIMINCFFSTDTMEYKPNILSLLWNQLALPTSGPVQTQIGRSFFQQSLETTKGISAKLVVSFYNNPKLILCTMLTTLLLMKLKNSPLWPITKHDLKKFKRESKKKAEQQLQQFIKNNDQATQDSTDSLKRSITSSHSQLVSLHGELGESEQDLTRISENLTKSLSLLDSQECTDQHELWNYARSHNVTLFNNLEDHAKCLKDGDERIIAHYLKLFTEHSSSLDHYLNRALQKIMQELAEETERLHSTMHHNKHQEELQINALNDSMISHYDTFSQHIDTMVLALTKLASEHNGESTDEHFA